MIGRVLCWLGWHRDCTAYSGDYYLVERCDRCGDVVGWTIRRAVL